MIDRMEVRRILKEMGHRPYYCETAFVNVVLAQDEVAKSQWNGNLVIGFAGFDGVEFQVDPCAHRKEVLAYNPNTGESGSVAGSIDELILKWEKDEIQYPF